MKVKIYDSNVFCQFPTEENCRRSMQRFLSFILLSLAKKNGNHSATTINMLTTQKRIQ